MPVAALGPLLVSVRVKVTFDPRAGAALSTVFVRLRSATGVGVTVTESSSSWFVESSPGVESGSGVPLADTCA